MSKCATASDALAFVERHGVVLVSAKGPAPKLIEAIVGEPIAGNWWAHPQSHHIYAIVEAVTESPQVLVCRLINGKVTLIHRRLWPALVRLAEHFSAEQVAQVHEEHTSSGRHVVRQVQYPEWVPPQVASQAKAMGEQEALVLFGPWLPTAKSAAKHARGVAQSR